MKFDARTAKLLPPNEHLTIDDCPGLRLHASTTGKAWIYRYKSPADGRMRQIKIGQWPSMSPASAYGKWDALRAERDAGRDPAVEKRAAKAAEMKPAPDVTVRKVCDWYLDGHIDRHRKAKGAVEVRRMFSTMLGTYAGKSATTFTRADAFALLETHVDIPVQAAKLRAELASAWDYALDAGRLPESSTNWWRLIMRGRLKSKGKKIEGESIGTAKRALSENEVGQLIEWLPNFSRTVADAATLYLWTCARGAEIMSMHKSEITKEKDGMWWTVPKAKTKNARHQKATDLRVPLEGRAVAIVKRRMDLSDGYLFPSSGKSPYIEQKSVQTAVFYHQPYSVTNPDSIRPRLPVTNWAPHDLRRTSRTLLASIGCPDGVAEAILGHTPAGIVAVYNRHDYDKERRVWLTRLSSHLESLVA